MPPWWRAAAKIRHEVQRHVIGVEALLALDGVGFPNQSIAGGLAAVAGLHQPDQLLVCQRVVFSHRRRFRDCSHARGAESGPGVTPSGYFLAPPGGERKERGMPETNKRPIFGSHHAA